MTPKEKVKDVFSCIFKLIAGFGIIWLAGMALHYLGQYIRL